ncbi:MAG: starch-binding protein, partial [Candidatus Izemoplasmatales bacterium]|nr:starch-binding protein [Candidatus Izemoplasmatales bacterium]
MKKKLLSMVFFIFLVGLTACGGISTDLPTTLSPTTNDITTVAPTTLSPTTMAPTTVAPTTVAPTTVAPTTIAPTTAVPTTEAPTTEAPVYTRVYFYNVLGWTEVYGYSFAGETRHLGDWPGTLATQESSSLWWYVDVMVDTDVDSFKIIFTNNNQVQSGEVTIDDDVYVYLSLPTEMKFSSKAEVESLISSSDTTTIWYYNSLAWDSVWFYAWGNNSNYFGAWPGVEAVKDSENDWWSITIPFDTGLIPISFKFHDNTGASVNDVNINTGGPFYVTQTGEVFASKEEAETSLSVTTRVYFLNSNGWEGISAYDEAQSLGDWPGTLMTQVETTDWWYVDVVGDINNISYNLVFSSENGYGTWNVIITEESGVYVTVNSEVFLTLEEAEASIYPEIMTDVWFYNSSKWSNVYAYAFNDTIEYTGKWPGKLAVREELTDWYKVSVPVDIATEGFTVIFNNYQDAQTSDVVLSNATDVYITIDGQVFSSKALAEEHMTVYTRIYFYNSNNWTDVYAYEDSGILGVWPGSNAIKDGETNWWYVDVVGDIQETSFLIKFHNNDTLAFRETSNVLIDSTSGLYITVNNKAFLTALDAENSIIAPVMTQVWFYNSDGWTDVYAYVFDDAGIYLGNWPGAEVYQDFDPDWWFIGVPIDVATADFTIVFSDGHTQQTPDTLITQSTGLYVTVDGVVHLSKTLAEEHLNVYTRIYFFNSNGWSNVVGYEDSTLLGSWPGTNATKDGETDWWYVDVLGDLETTSFLIKFHNADPKPRETYNVTIDNSTGVYVTVNSKAFTTAVEAEASIYPATMTTVWFHNTDLWSEVYAYAFVDIDEYTGKWPGKLAVKDEFSDWYSISLPFDYSTDEIHLIFNDGSGMQSTEFVVNSTSGLYMISEGLMFDDLGSAEAYLFPLTTIYFYNSNNWTTVYAYVFIDSDEFLGTWPGTLAYMDVDSGWWAIDVPLNVEPIGFTVVFNDGDSLQTPDVMIDTIEGIYVDVNGNIYTTKIDAENFVNTYTRVYFYNSDLWTDVWINAANTFPDDPLFSFSGQMTKEDSSDWWYVDLQVDPSLVNIDFAFNDNDALYTDNAYLTNTTTVYATVRGYMYASKELAEASMLETVTRVYFYNSEQWSEVWAYAEESLLMPL